MPGLSPMPKSSATSSGAKNDPLHGVTLKALLQELIDIYGWDGLARRISINCFKSDPSLQSSLKFLRRTPWARQKVERLYLDTKYPKNNPWLG